MISTRQQSLLTAIIKEYIDSAKAVSSGQLVEQERFDVSPATVRNDMAELTDAGYLHQPHTSAGRIPTEKAWRWYIDQESRQAPLTKREQAILRSVVESQPQQADELMRRVAKVMAEMVEESVLVAWGKHDTYYTGLSNLFVQPEFEHLDLVQSLSKVVDQLDDVVARFYDQVGNDPQVMVGKDNPFGRECGTIIVRYNLGGRTGGLIGILGPLRQDYAENMALMRYTTKLLEKL